MDRMISNKIAESLVAVHTHGISSRISVFSLNTINYYKLERQINH